MSLKSVKKVFLLVIDFNIYKLYTLLLDYLLIF